MLQTLNTQKQIEILDKDSNNAKCSNIYEYYDKYLSRYRNNKKVLNTYLSDYQTKSVYLFVINFHHKNYSSIYFIRNVIYNLFALYYPNDFDLLFLGPITNETLLVYGNDLPKGGYYSYHSLKVALDLFPRECGYYYSGYFLANDDSCLQPTLLGQEDHNRAMAETWYDWSVESHWWWNHKKNSNRIPFSEAYITAINEVFQNSVTRRLCSFNSSQLRRGWADFFYLPQSNIYTFLKLETIFFKNKVFLENTVPFIMNCLNATILTDCNHGKMPNREKCVHLHPVKYSRANERAICINRITNTTLLERPDTYFNVCNNLN